MPLARELRESVTRRFKWTDSAREYCDLLYAGLPAEPDSP